MELMVTQKFNVVDFLERLSRARTEGRATIEIDFDKVTHPSSPLPFESFKGQIAYIYLAVIVVALGACKLLLALGWRDSLIVGGVVSLVYWIVARGLLERWAKRKIVAHLLSDGENWDKMWRYGGLTLSVGAAGASDPSEPTTWVAPKGDWREALPKL